MRWYSGVSDGEDVWKVLESCSVSSNQHYRQLTSECSDSSRSLALARSSWASLWRAALISSISRADAVSCDSKSAVLS